MSDTLTVEQCIEAAPKDHVEKDVDVPSWGGKVRIRTLTAGQFANVKSASLRPNGRGVPQTDIAAMEQLQFYHGVIAPKFDLDQVKGLQITSSTGFKVIIDALDELQGGTEKEQLAKATAAFPVGDVGREADVQPG
jgi:hypothetical protein